MVVPGTKRREWRKLLRWEELPVVLIFVLAFILRLVPATPYVYNDELGGGYTGYGYVAWGYLDTANVYAAYLSRFDLGGLFSWSLQYGSLTPLTPLLAATAMLLHPSPNPLDVARIPVSIMSALTCVALYYYGKWSFDRRTGLLAAFGFAVSTVSVLSGRLLYEDAGSVLFGTVALAFAARPGTQSRLLAQVVPGVFIGLAVASKLLGLIFLAIIILANVRWRGLLHRGGGIHGWFRNLGVRPWSGVIVTAIASVLTIAVLFPWVLPALLPRTHLATDYVTSGPTGVVRLFQVPLNLAGRVDPVSLLLSILGAAWFLRRLWNTGPRSAGDRLLFGWLVTGILMAIVISPFLYQYMLFLLPPLLLLTAIGFWRLLDLTLATLQGTSSRPAARTVTVRVPRGDDAQSDPDRPQDAAPARGRSSERGTTRAVLAGLSVLLVIASLSLPMVTNLSYPGLYYSPLVGGIQPASKFLPVEGNEILPDVAGYVKAHFPAGSLIIAAGSVHLVKYFLPDYVVRGASEFYPNYLDSPLEYFQAMNVSAVVIQLIAVQAAPADPLLEALALKRPSWSVSYDGVTLAWIYDRAALGPLTAYQSFTPPYKSWTVSQGTLTVDGVLSPLAGYANATVRSPSFAAPSACTSVAAVFLGTVGAQTQSFQVGFEFVNGSAAGNGTFTPAELATGLLVVSLPQAICGQSMSARITLTVFGPGASVQITSVVILEPA